jgi:hypothetical protein
MQKVTLIVPDMLMNIERLYRTAYYYHLDFSFQVDGKVRQRNGFKLDGL